MSWNDRVDLPYFPPTLANHKWTPTPDVLKVVTSLPVNIKKKRSLLQQAQDKQKQKQKQKNDASKEKDR